MFSFELPYPPSANHRLGWGGGRAFKTAKYKSFEAQCLISLTEQKIKPCRPLKTPAKWHLRIKVYPPDKRRRDLGNVEKCVCDVLQRNNIIEDDYDIWILEIIRKENIPQGKVIITLWDIHNQTT